MSTRSISITGARGGHGASTVAATLALYAAGHQPTTLVAPDLESMAALLGVAVPSEGAQDVAVTPTLTLARSVSTASSEFVVIDRGSRPDAPQSPEVAERYIVVRGPCYLALRSLVAHPGEPYDGVILMVEAGRSLRAADVAQVLEVPVVAEIGWSAAVARAIDAGILPGRHHQLRDLAALRSLAVTPPRLPSHRPPTTHPTRTRSTPVPTLPTHPNPFTLTPTPSESGTDLPCPLFQRTRRSRRPWRDAHRPWWRDRTGVRPPGGPKRAQHRETASGGGRLLPG
jgi:hypothetical protein